MDAIDASRIVRKPTTEKELNTILIEVFGAVPLDQVLTKPGLEVRVVRK